jgi:hypothetical protein
MPEFWHQFLTAAYKNLSGQSEKKINYHVDSRVLVDENPSQQAQVSANIQSNAPVLFRAGNTDRAQTRAVAAPLWEVLATTESRHAQRLAASEIRQDFQ